MSTPPIGLTSLVEMLRDAKGAVDKAWDSPEVIAARDRAKATLEKVTPENADEYWRGVRRRMRESLIAKGMSREEAERKFPDR